MSFCCFQGCTKKDLKLENTDPGSNGFQMKACKQLQQLTSRCKEWKAAESDVG